MKMYIRVMSSYDKDIRRKIIDSSDKVIEHLVKLILYPDTEYVNGWKQEVYSFLHRIDKTKRNKRYPSYKFILEALSTHLDTIHGYKMCVVDEMQECKVNPLPFSDYDVTNMCKKYMDWLSHQLSDNGYVTQKEVYTWIDSNIID